MSSGNGEGTSVQCRGVRGARDMGHKVRGCERSEDEGQGQGVCESMDELGPKARHLRHDSLGDGFDSATSEAAKWTKDCPNNCDGNV